MLAVASQETEPQSHPAADLFPMLSDDALAPLIESMRVHGFEQNCPILRYRGVILDGRNRFRAAAIAGVVPIFRDISEDCDPWQESWRLNGLRRALTPGQKAAILVKITSASTEWHAERARLRLAANEARATSQAGLSKEATRERRASAEATRSDTGKTAAALAAKAGVARSTVERAMQLQREAPEKLDAIIRGDKPERKKPAPRIDHEQRYSDVLRLHGEGAGNREIAAKLNIHPSAVSKAKSELGVASNSAPLKLWQDVDHVTLFLESASMRIEQLTEQLVSGEVFAAGEEEIERCIKSLSMSAATVKHLRNALKQRCR